MINDEIIKLPRHYAGILEQSEKENFTMPSDLKTGSLLRSLAASKPGGKILELGTGTGLSLTWIAEGADSESEIVSIDNDPKWQNIAMNAFKDDKRISFRCVDANDWLKHSIDLKFDLIFADAWPGKFENLEKALDLIRVGGFYIIDDLLPQPNWPDGHQKNVDNLFDCMIKKNEFVYTTLNWSTGLMLFTKIK